MKLVDALILVGFCKSKTEARKAILNGAIKINDEKIIDPERILTPLDYRFPNIDHKSFHNDEMMCKK